MFEKQGGANKNSNTGKKGALNNKEVIAEYDEVLSKEDEAVYKSKLDILKEKLGLGADKKTPQSALETNLIDDESVATFIDWKSSIRLFVSYFIVLLLILVGSFVYITYLEAEKEKKADTYEDTIRSLQTSIASQEKDVENGLTLQKKVAALEGLLDRHIYWTNFFEYLEKNTLDKVYYSGFGGGVDGEYSLSATAEDAYFTATEQLKSFREDKFSKEVDISSLSASEEEEGTGKTIGFNLQLKVDPDIFLIKKEK